MCLVEQLFRQKIGLSIDPGLVSSLIWPFLFQEKHAPRSLLQDIHLVRQADPNGEAEDRRSAIIYHGHAYFKTKYDINRFGNDTVPQLPGQDVSERCDALRQLCQIGIVNRFRSIKNPTIVMGQDNRDRDEYREHGPQGWLPYMDTTLVLEEKSDHDLMQLHRRDQERKFGIATDLSSTEWTDHIKEQRTVDNDNINSYIGSIIRNKRTLKWEVKSQGMYGDEPYCSLRFTCYNHLD